MLRTKCKTLLLGIACCFSAAAFAALDEANAIVLDVKVNQNKIVLDSDEYSGEYELAFDVNIHLANGDSGTMTNIKAGDDVSVVIDADEKLLHSLFVMP